MDYAFDNLQIFINIFFFLSEAHSNKCYLFSLVIFWDDLRTVGHRGTSQKSQKPCKSYNMLEASGSQPGDPNMEVVLTVPHHDGVTNFFDDIIE